MSSSSIQSLTEMRLLASGFFYNQRFSHPGGLYFKHLINYLRNYNDLRFSSPQPFVAAFHYLFCSSDM